MKSSKSSNSKFNPIIPSEFAKKIKAQADKLIAQTQYNAAFSLLTDALKKDKTVAAYNDFIKRTKDIVEISK